MSAHTTGPWSISCVGYGASIEPSIAWVGYGSSYPKEENKANAKLISAAPDLLEALIGMLKNTGAFPSDNPDSVPGPNIKAALIAIRKATVGNQP